MAANLGKRKRQATGEATEKPRKSKRESSEELDSALEDAQAIFRRHFEAQFKPLPEVKKAAKPIEAAPEEEESQEDESEWDGLSEVEETEVQVVEHTDAQSRMAAMSKEELKAFMSSKVPRSAPEVSLLRDKAGSAIPDDDDSEAANLKKDLALQRLLAESHLLESSSNTTVSGKNRHKATDMRIQALGSKTSILKQEKMPMLHRKGIIAKQTDRETTRRKEAKENGIILEKAKNDKKRDGKRDRGVGAPGVGKFSGGTLKLSKKDIFDIEGPKKSSAGRGGRGGKRGGRGRGKSF
ncbi:hypothetical protein BP5796_06259 [Coleophoma crateriformis]|uniref:Protein FAF1 n=1 Tax=Coleophoma crateriformis TaxID=565419 RepID=A0A3D8RWI7_9HELO|nr:hypothetical protein BP5796_06259 [Coleophoma crateriformis]